MLQRLSSSNIKQECSKHGQPRPSMLPSAMPRRQRPTIVGPTSQSRTSTIACSAVAEPSVPSELTEAEQRTCQPASTSYTQTLPDRKQLRDNQGRLMLKNLTLKEMEQWCISIGERKQRALQIWRWMYADDNWVASLEDTLGRQNGFSSDFLSKIRDLATVDGGLELQQVARAKDGTRKLVFKLTCGEGAGGTVETVLIPVVREQGKKPRITVCVSSQVGCAMNCQFCYTGRMGLMGNLSTAQIVEQLVAANRLMEADGDAATLTNVVFMGMGEPLHNLPAVLAACDAMCCPLGLHMSHNKVTVSTVGLAPEIRQFMQASRCQLALSLHATTDEVRDWIVPVNRRHDLQELKEVLAEFFSLGNSAGRKLMIEYTMLRDINDTEEDAARLADLTADLACKVNLITFNPHQGTRFQPSPMEQVLAFRSVLIKAGRVCTIRDSRGDDEMAACGQLGNPQLSSKAAPILEPPERFRHLVQA